MAVGTGFNVGKFVPLVPKPNIGDIKSLLIGLEAEIANKGQAELCL